MRYGLADEVARFATAEETAGWAALPFVATGEATRLALALDARAKAGAHILPPAPDVFAAFRMTPADGVRVVILGQDPYPTPGDAHGLAFSYRGGRRLPPSLRTVLDEAGGGRDLSLADLARWARQGVLLLNTVLTVEAGKAGAHLGLGWEEMARQAIRKVSGEGPGAAFMLWGGKARELAREIEPTRNLVLECGHPSPLNRHRDFRGCGHFEAANRWLASKGRGTVDWSGGARPDDLLSGLSGG